jgi:superfamily II DNA or RNA helicase
MDIKPRDYQGKFDSQIREAVGRGHKRLIACASTGSGKSIQLAMIAKSALSKHKKILIFLPRKSLVLQLSKTFSKYNIDHSVLMSGEPYYSGSKCQIISIDTYTARLSSGRMLFIDADVICLDEMHIQHTKAKVELFSKYPFVIAFTATPDVSKKLPLNTLYTKIVESISMKELVDMGHLVPLRYFSPADFHPTDIKINSDGEYNGSQLDEYIDSKLKTSDGKLKLVGDVYNNWKRIAPDRQTVIFCKTQAHSRFIVNEFLDHGVKALYIDCNTPNAEREQIYRDMETGKAQVLVNVFIVGIGIDIPVLSCTVIAVPINKINKYLQCVGRLTRPHPESGKTDGIVIDHCGVVSKLGFADEQQYWTLEGKETPEEIKKKAKEEAKEPKILTCDECGTSFTGRRICPSCQYESIPKGEDIPYHQAELKEIKSKPTPLDKEAFYAQLLGYSRTHSKPDSFALAIFRRKHDSWPYNKKSIKPIPPSPETLGYIKHSQIAYAKRKRA